MTKTLYRSILLSAGLALAGLGYHYVSGKPVTPPADPVIPVSMQTAEVRDLPIWLEAVGSVQALNVVNVKVRVDGQLQKVSFVEGQTVRAGDALAEIDPRPFQAQLAQAVATKAKDEAQLASARVELDRADQLAAAMAGPKQAAETLRAQSAMLQATVQADEAAVENARLQLSFTHITAPITGRTGQRLASVGAIVHASDAAGLVAVTQMNPISVLFALPQDHLAEIMHESAAKPLAVVAMSRDGSQRIAQGTLVFIDSQVSAANGQVQFKAAFDNANGALWPGELVSARILLRTQAGAITVPATAVQQGQNGNFVYVVKKDRTVEARKVEAGAVVSGSQWIRKGIEAGETVVTQGQYRIAPGTKVSAVATADRP
jgi:multidrug efflux system membrane fusion protein